MHEESQEDGSQSMTDKTTCAPAGKNCTRCLCCPAVISFEGENLCAACDDGTHPPLPKSHRAPMTPVMPTLAKIIGASAVVTEALFVAYKLRSELFGREKSMTTTIGGGRGRQIDPEIKRAVLAASPTISNCELARQYDISDKTVQKWRCAAGIRSIATRRVTRFSAKATQPETLPGDLRIRVEGTIS
jgi:hypothetical protein